MKLNQKTCIKTRVIDREKNKTLIEAKPVANINKSLLEIHPVLKFLLHINCETMHMSSRILSDERKITSHGEIARMN